MPIKILILGGGLAGLSAALELKQSNIDLDIIILEKKPYFGGLAASFEQEGYKIPIFYHHIIQSNKVTIKYLKRYGLLKYCKWKRIKLAIATKGKINNINSIKGLLSYNDLSLYGKLRFGLFGLYVIFLMNPNKIDNKLDSYQWLKKYAGKEVTKKIFYNLYARNKFNIPLSRISAKQFANRLKERETYDKFTYPSIGLEKMIHGIINELKSYKVKLLNQIEIISLNPKTKRVKYKLDRKIIEQDYDILINTIPIPEFLKIAKHLPKNYKEQLSKIRYCPAVGIAFATDRFLDKKHYWINLFNEIPHIIIQHSILNDNYPWKVSWILRYGGSEEDLKKDEELIRKDYLNVISKYFPNTKIVWSKVFKEKYAEPIYDKDYIEYKPNYITPLKDIYMAGIQVTYPKIRNMNTALESGEKVARIIIKSILKK